MSEMKKIIIAIDGHSSCGKSTFAKSIAKYYGYVFIDTGAMYRAVTLYAIANGIVTPQGVDVSKLENSLKRISIDFKYDNQLQKSFVYLNGENVESKIRGVEVSSSVSAVSQNSSVRALLVKLQQKMGENKGIVMDGRDIGTTVFPNAELKIFMTASVEIRAQRRYDELVAKGENVSLEEITNNIIDRDRQDETREISPLICAADALVLDNSTTTVAEQMEWIVQKIDKLIK